MRISPDGKVSIGTIGSLVNLLLYGSDVTYGQIPFWICGDVTAATNFSPLANNSLGRLIRLSPSRWQQAGNTYVDLGFSQNNRSMYFSNKSYLDGSYQNVGYNFIKF